MNIKKLAAAGVALSMAAMSLVGCSGKTSGPAATYNGGEIPSGVYIFNQVNAANEAYSKLSDPTATADSILKQQIDGVTAEEWINNRTVELVKTYAAVASEAARLQLVADEATVSTIKQQLESNWKTEGDAMEKLGISLSSAQAIGVNSQLSNQLFQSYYGEGGEKAVAESELKAYFTDNFRRSLMVVIPRETDSASAAPENTDAEKKATPQEVFDGYKARISAGESVFDVLVSEEQRQRDLAGNTETAELVEAQQETIVNRESTGFPQALKDKIFETTELNTAQFYEDDDYFVIFDLRDTFGDGTAFNNAKQSLLLAYKGDEYREGLVAMADSIGFKLNSDVVKNFKVKSIIGSK